MTSAIYPRHIQQGRNAYMERCYIDRECEGDYQLHKTVISEQDCSPQGIYKRVSFIINQGNGIRYMPVTFAIDSTMDDGAILLNEKAATALIAAGRLKIDRFQQKSNDSYSQQVL